jgi:flavin reductase (NADH)
MRAFLRSVRSRLRGAPMIDVESALQSIDRERFAEIMGALASGVSVITTLDARGAPKGLTTTAVCSASAEPPLLLTCIDRRSRTLPALRRSKRFVVNFMRAGGDDVCLLFASKRDDKFDQVEWVPTPSGLPVLSGHAIAWTECRTTAEYSAGDHVILLGHIEDGDLPEADPEPLVYYRRSWGLWHRGG